MDEDVERKHATQPEDLSRLIVERLNAGDVDGVVALYEPRAVLALPGGRIATGTEEIRNVYEQLLVDKPTFAPGAQRPTLRSADLALTSSHLASGVVTAEVARRQAGRHLAAGPRQTQHPGIEAPAIRVIRRR